MKILCLGIALVVLYAAALPAVVRAEIFTAYLTGAQEVPPVATDASGYARIHVDETSGTLTFEVVFNDLSGPQTASHVHAPAAVGTNGAISIDLGAVGGTSGRVTGAAQVTPAQIVQLRQHLWYVNVHSTNFGNGEIRGQLGPARPVDYDGDGRTDLSVMRSLDVDPPGNAQITFWNQNSTDGVQVVEFGDANRDIAAPGDYDGDGKTDFAVYRRGTAADVQGAFFVLNSGSGTVSVIPFGTLGDIVVARDYDGDGKADPAIFRRGVDPGDQAVWWVLMSSTNSVQIVAWGTTGTGNNNGDVPVPGDYDGDGKHDLAVYRFGGLVPSNCFIILQSSDGTAHFRQWGMFSVDRIVPGDYDGDGRFDLAVARSGLSGTSPLRWWILKSSDSSVRVETLGVSANLPVQGDYDGDGVTDIAAYNSGIFIQSTFRVLNSLDGSTHLYRWGLGGDYPVANFDTHLGTMPFPSGRSTK